MSGKLTLSMIVKNEEKYLRDCLESVKDVVDEIVLIDTGSTDKTIQIASEYKAEIFHYPWKNDFSDARNYALSKTRGDWILYLDADERLSLNSKENLKRIISKNDAIGYRCIVQSFADGERVSQSMKYTRLFKFSKNIRFSGKVHEQIDPSLIKNKYKFEDAEIIINHIGYNITKEGLKGKARRNLNILLQEYASKDDPYTTYQVANSYFILDEVESAVKFYKKSISSTELSDDLKSICYSQIADFEMRKKNLQGAKKYIDKGLSINKNHPLQNIIAAQIYGKLNNDKSLEFCKQALINSKKSLNYCYSNNIQEVSVDSKDIIYEGILLSQKFENHSIGTHFIKELKKIDLHEGDIIEKLKNQRIEIGDLESLISVSNERNIQIILQFIESHENIELKATIYSRLYELFDENSKFLNKFGSFLLKINQIVEAKIILEKSISFNDCDESSFLYLISIYIQTNEFDKLTKLMNILENNSEFSLELRSKLELIKSKISAILP